MARATKTTVMIHSTISLLRFFSSAIQTKYTTAEFAVQVLLLIPLWTVSLLRLRAGHARPCPLVPSQLENLAHVDRLCAEVQRVIHARVGREPVVVYVLAVADEHRADLLRLILLGMD